MRKVETDNMGNLYHYYPAVAIIVTANVVGRMAAMAAAWNMPISHTPPIYCVAVSPKRYTYQAIVGSGEFAVNFLPFGQIELIERIGANSSREVDKFREFGIETEKAEKISAPIMKAAYATYECKMIDHRPYGDHELIAGDVVAVHYDTDAFNEDGTLNAEVVKPALYLGGDRYTGISSESPRHLERERYKVRVGA